MYEVPQTHERMSGRDAYVRFNRDYPGEWYLQVRAAYEGDSGGAAEVSFQVGGEELVNVAFFELSAGRVGPSATTGRSRTSRQPVGNTSLSAY